MRGRLSKRIDPPLRVDGHRDEAVLAEHPEVFRHRRLAEAGVLHEFADTGVGAEEPVEDPTPARLGDHFEQCAHEDEYA